MSLEPQPFASPERVEGSRLQQGLNAWQPQQQGEAGVPCTTPPRPHPSGPGLLPCSSQARETSPEALCAWKGRVGSPVPVMGSFLKKLGEREGGAVILGQL